MKRNQLRSALLFFLLLFVLTGCSGSKVSSKQGNTPNQVEKTLNAQIAAAKGSESSDSSSASEPAPITEAPPSYEKVDCDLTKMNSDMVYSTVLNMMEDPDDYVGQCIRVKGTLSIFSDKAADRTYYTCVIADATACCAQGIEFLWGDGEHDPSDYPAEDTKIEVTGIFETYQEDDATYCRLKQADMHAVQFNIT